MPATAARPRSRSGLDPLTTALLVLSLVLAVFHHTDHVLRFDHSGWPFREDVTTFTYSLFIYPLVLFALLGPARLYWLRWALIALGTAFVLYAHTIVETPAGQYGTWAHNHSTDPESAGAPNLLDLASPGLGAIAVVLSMALNLTAIAATVAMLVNGIRTRPGRGRSSTSSVGNAGTRRTSECAGRRGPGVTAIRPPSENAARCRLYDAGSRRTSESAAQLAGRVTPSVRR